MPGAVPLWDKPMDFLLGRTLRPKIAAKFGGRIKAMVSGGAPLNPEVGIFFHVARASPCCRATARPNRGRC